MELASAQPAVSKPIADQHSFKVPAFATLDSFEATGRKGHPFAARYHDGEWRYLFRQIHSPWVLLSRVPAARPEATYTLAKSWMTSST